MHRQISRAVFFFEYRAWFVAILELGLILLALTAAWLIVEGPVSPPARAAWIIPVFVAVRLFFIGYFRLFHGWWRYTGINDAIDVWKAVSFGAAVLLAAAYLAQLRLPISIYLIEAIFTFLLLCVVRLLSRMVAESVRDVAVRTRVGIIGAGFAAQQIIRELKLRDSRYDPVACFDDNEAKTGIALHGVPVVGTIDQLPEQWRRYGIRELLVAVPSATAAQMRRFVEKCEQTGLPFKTVPSLRELLSGKGRLNQIRTVALEDLLGRDPVAIDLDSVRRDIEGKVVMVTGAAGSIGSELTRQIISYHPARLLCVDQNETGMFYLERELAANNGAPAEMIVCNVADAEQMQRLCFRNQVSIIFHAAAYKHVPLMETNIHEAVSNNVFALLQLLSVAERSGCGTFVMVSSDKAVNPTNVMGCTKRIAELMLTAWPSNGMRCISVRFGNVLGSNGSVIPVFQELLRQNRPLTVTHPEIKRFFMTIPEAVGLVLEACCIGRHRDILVLDMGEPVSLTELARTLIRISGKRPEDVPIHYTGLRKGEKLCEELFYHSEHVTDTECAKIKRTTTARIPWSEFALNLEALRESLRMDDADCVRRVLKTIVPQYQYASGPAPLAPTGKSESEVAPMAIIRAADQAAGESAAPPN